MTQSDDLEARRIEQDRNLRTDRQRGRIELDQNIVTDPVFDEIILGDAEIMQKKGASAPRTHADALQERA